MTAPGGDPVTTSADPTVPHGPGSRPRRQPVVGPSWWWLLVGTGLLPFTNLQTPIPLTAWLAPVVLLRFTRSQRPVIAVAVLLAATCAALLFGLWGAFFPIEESVGCSPSAGALAFGGV